MANSKRGPTAVARRPEVLPATEDIRITQEIGELLRAFVAGVVGFFKRAGELEQGALQTLDQARQLQAPADADDDEGIQRFIKRVNDDRKIVAEHWKITSTIHQFHRRMTGRRDRADQPLEQAGKIAQDHHNRYADAERRRAQLEQERVEREAREKAEADRHRELEALEREALRAEAKSGDLSDREANFVRLVAGGLNSSTSADLAARNAGFKLPNMAARLMAMPKIQRAIEARKKADAARQQKAALELSPLDVQVEDVRPDLRRAAGAVDRTTKSAELLDARKLIDAVIAGGHGIPNDVLMVNEVKLNQYARDLGELINRWPGVRLKKTTRTV